MSDNQQVPTTFGEILVGLDFNPSQDPKIQKAKQLCAELADLVNDHWYDASTTDFVKTGISSMIYNEAIGQILSAQMMAVKLFAITKNQ